MLKRNLKTALRRLIRKREFTAINVLGLVIGLTTSLFIFLWVNDELQYDGFHQNQENIYSVWTNFQFPNGEINTGNDQTGALKEALETDYPEIEKVARINHNPEVQVSFGDKHFKDKGIFADEEFFQIFNFPLVDGQLTEESLATDKDIILTESLAIKLFGRKNVSGEVVKLDNRVDAIVRGVVQDPPKNSRFQFAYALSMQSWLDRNEWAMGWGNGALLVYLTVSENSNIDLLNQKIEGLNRKYQSNSIRTPFLKPFSEIYLYGDYENGELVGGRIEYVRLFTIIAIFIICIACINFINLSIAESFKRAKEIGVRKVVGAGKTNLIKEFLI
ncbi:MAG TPA: ABC transporter permease, partial [Roseivirga sp.]